MYHQTLKTFDLSLNKLDIDDYLNFNFKSIVYKLIVNNFKISEGQMIYSSYYRSISYLISSLQYGGLSWLFY